MYTTILSLADLAPHLGDDAWAVVDCRFSLGDPARGRRDYLTAHIPGAVYAHLDEDLSGPVVPGHTGRHPLPDVDRLAKTFSAWGIGDGVQVVTYDDAGGSVAARLWWLLRWLGHDAVAVLDGGWPRWQQEGLPVRSGEESRPPRAFTPRPRPGLLADATEVERLRRDPSSRVLDARAAERYRGEIEPIDPVAGHIPGAGSAPFSENLDPDGYFRTPEELRARFDRICGNVPPERVVHYCGSGVTAAHNVLAMAHAGLEGARLYAGSWSEWITDPDRPVVAGPEAP